MNQKICKALRRQARALTVGKADRRLMVKPRKRGWHSQPTLINDPRTTRGVYLRMKREVRAGLRIGR